MGVAVRNGGGMGGETGGSETGSVVCGGGEEEVVAFVAAKKRRTPFIYGVGHSKRLGQTYVPDVACDTPRSVTA